MVSGKVLFETKVAPQEGSPYLATKGKKVQLLLTTEEIRFNDPKWTFAIPLHRIFNCIAKPLPVKRVIAGTFSAPSVVEIMNNCLVIEYLDEHGQKSSMLSVFAQHVFIKSNIVDTIRFNEAIDKYHLREKLIQELENDSAQGQPN